MNELQQASREVSHPTSNSTFEGPSTYTSLNELAVTASSQQHTMTYIPRQIVAVGQLKEEARRLVGLGYRVVDAGICCEAIRWVLHFANNIHHRYYEGSKIWRKTILAEWESDNVWTKQFPVMIDKPKSYEWRKFMAFCKLANIFGSEMTQTIFKQVQPVSVLTASLPNIIKAGKEHLKLTNTLKTFDWRLFLKCKKKKTIKDNRITLQEKTVATITLRTTRVSTQSNIHRPPSSLSLVASNTAVATTYTTTTTTTTTTSPTTATTATATSPTTAAATACTTATTATTTTAHATASAPATTTSPSSSSSSSLSSSCRFDTHIHAHIHTCTNTPIHAHVHIYT